MFCTQCGNKLHENSVYCDKCGHKVNGSVFNLRQLGIFKLGRHKYLVVAALFFAIAIAFFWMYASFFKWVHVPVSGDRYREFHYERRLIFPQNYLQNIKILINMNERSNLNELSFVLDAHINCLTDDQKIGKVTSFFKKNGQGDVLHVNEGFRYFGPGFNAVKNEVCKQGLKKVSAQPNQKLDYHELNIHLGSFLECRTNFKLRQKLLKTVKPNQKKDGYWIYETTGFAVDNFGNYAKLPVKQMIFGVCNESGALDCGQAMYTALIFDMPKNEVRRNLLSHRRLGIDFTIESREAESEATLRAHLVDFGKNNTESALYCDSGTL